MSTVLLATCANLPTGDEDAPLLVAALADRDVRADWVVWTDPPTDVGSSLVVLRSTWDYHQDRDGFLRWTAGLPRVANGADVVAWNTDKTYLRDLADAGVPVVPSSFAAPGETVALPGDVEFVAKPSVGAGSRGVGRFAPERGDEARAHIAALHDAGRTVLVQPYLTDVDTAGETALVYLDGRFSHAIRKAPMLPDATTHSVDGAELYVEERITPRTPSSAEFEVGDAALAAVRARFGADQLYTRVDLLPGPEGPVVGELELTEPSLFLGYDQGAADRFAAAIAVRL